MAVGIYIHVPFCKTRCHYCDFYSCIETDLADIYTDTVVREIEQRKKYFDQGEPVDTVYFGGGTPSAINSSLLRKILLKIQQEFPVISKSEITLEANPDDIDREKLREWMMMGINRLSIGVQTLDDVQLRRLNRRHDAAKALEAVNLGMQTGYENISIDLIYGLNFGSNEAWGKTLEQIKDLPVQHISAYHLTIEGKTMFQTLKNAGELEEMDEDQSLQQFSLLRKTLKDAGYDHYEISNFSKNGYTSRHNMKYWKGVSYLGLGPSAHSFDGINREWNPSDIREYFSLIRRCVQKREHELISMKQAYNEAIMTSLRLSEGIDLNEFEGHLGQKNRDQLQEDAYRFVTNGLMEEEDHFLRLSEKGLFLADGIIAELFKD